MEDEEEAAAMMSQNILIGNNPFVLSIYSILSLFGFRIARRDKTNQTMEDEAKIFCIVIDLECKRRNAHCSVKGTHCASLSKKACTFF